MIYLLQSSWLAAAAAVVIPVALHLWNDRRGKVLRVGSVAMLTGDSQRMAWSRRLSQRWLLLLRCLLLLALAFLLAGPYWRRDARASGKGWVLEAGDGVSPGGLRTADSLVQAGWERHPLEDSENYWNGFRIADREAPAGSPFYVLTNGLARRFAGERPVTNRDVSWDVGTPDDSISRWVEAAWPISPTLRDSIRVVEGESNSTGTRYVREVVASDRRPGVVDTSVMRLTIFTDPAYRQDGRYVEAALRAVQQLTRRPMAILVTSQAPERADWCFWLSARPLPVGGTFTHVVQYAIGKERVVSTWVGDIEWMKEVEGQAAGQKAVWEDGYGRAVLAEEGSAIYRFYSRFDPDWSGLVWSRAFPVLLERLVFGGERVAVQDRRVLDPAQIAPLRGEEGKSGIGKKEVREGAVDLAPLCWALIVLLFILERVVSHGKRKT